MATAPKPPPSQRYLQISFALMTGGREIGFMTLPIKPEELTRSEPSRMSVVNTIGGAWVDSFGRGLTTLTISGNTGWGSNGRPDGISQFSMLRDDFIHRWHDLRQARISDGLDPDQVRLIFIDPLNGNYVANVIPMTFTLRRSRSHPLLLVYNIVMTVTSETAENPYPELLEEMVPNLKEQASVASAGASVTAISGVAGAAGAAGGAAAGAGGLIGKLDGMAAKIGSLGASALDATKNTFGPIMSEAQKIIETAAAAKRVLTAAEQATVGVARELAATAKKVWDAAGAVAGLPGDAKAAIAQIKGEFSNLGCVLSNGFAEAIGKATVDTPPYGASNCSSTAGGRAPSDGSNPFTGSALPGPVSTSPDSVAAINAINAMDLTKPIDQAELAALLARVKAGVVVEGVADDSTPVPIPVVTSISPNFSFGNLKKKVTITGVNLSGATQVKINGVSCTVLSANTATSVTCFTPFSTVYGQFGVTVTTPGGVNVANTLFSYTDSTPTVAPTSAPTANPTTAPTGAPTSTPTSAPSVSPTAAPTLSPAGLTAYDVSVLADPNYFVATPTTAAGQLIFLYHQAEAFRLPETLVVEGYLIYYGNQMASGGEAQAGIDLIHSMRVNSESWGITNAATAHQVVVSRMVNRGMSTLGATTLADRFVISGAIPTLAPTAAPTEAPALLIEMAQSSLVRVGGMNAAKARLEATGLEPNRGHYAEALYNGVSQHSGPSIASISFVTNNSGRASVYSLVKAPDAPGSYSIGCALWVFDGSIDAHVQIFPIVSGPDTLVIQ